MLEKILPWWRKALNFAFEGIRSGFGLFPGLSKPIPSEEEVFFDRLEHVLEETALTDPAPNSQTIPTAPATAAAVPSASEPIPAPVPAAVMEPVAVQATASATAAPKESGQRLVAESVTGIETNSVARPLDANEAALSAEPVPAPAIEPCEPAIEAAPPPPRKAKPAARRMPAKEPASKPVPPVEPVSVPEPAAAVDPLPASSSAVDTSIAPTPTLLLVSQLAPNRNPAQIPAQNPSATRRPSDASDDLSPFSVTVSQVYDGPLDLLLDLIRKQDIDIYDIPIARITAQFLAYVNQLKATDVDVAGEFIYTASLLIHIKSKMLLPRAPSGPDDDAEDPRRELVERLLEHERFKNAAQMLQQKQMLESATWSNPGFREFADDATAEPEIAADTVDLVRIFRDILERASKRPMFDLEEDSVTVGQMIRFLGRRLTMEDKPVALRRLLSHTRSERALVAMFLALLELVRLQAILLRQDRAFSEIFIKKHTGFDAVMNEGLTNALDDWR
jgi:segregation and condensation protein A